MDLNHSKELMMRKAATWFSLLALQMVLVAALEGAPRVPRSDAEVLERVPLRSGVDATRGTRGWSQLSYEQALGMAQGWMKDWEKLHDPALVGRVQVVLRRWWGMEDPPAEVRLLRARVRQYGHDFEGAIRDLEKLTKEERVAPEVWAMLSSVHLVRGDHGKARESALEMARRHPGLWATATAAAVAGVSGQANEAAALLYRSLRQNGSEDRVLRAWCWGLLGELSGQLGRTEEAVRYLRSALELDPGRSYARVALADELLESNRVEEAWEILKEVNQADSDALVVRKAMVLKRLGRMEGEGRELVARLKAGFEAARVRGVVRHLREEAMLEALVLDRWDVGLEWARANWELQKEPTDARLLSRLARGAGNGSVLEGVRLWCQSAGLEDVRLAEAFRVADASR